MAWLWITLWILLAYFLVVLLATLVFIYLKVRADLPPAEQVPPRHASRRTA